jgi:hypothetical protein
MITEVFIDMRAFTSLLIMSIVMFAVITTRLFNGLELTEENADNDNSLG